MTKKDPDYDYEEIIERLLLEIRQRDALLTPLESLLYLNEKTTRLTMLGAVKALYRMIDERDKKIEKLERELDQLIFSKKGK
jgi:hypothetical protein